MIINILSIIVVFGLMIFVHELGHFIVAKKSKIQVNEFSLGFGPAIYKKQVDETLYAIRLIPLGGFVSLEGEESFTKVDDNEKAFYNKPLFNRIALLFAGGLNNLILGYILLLVLTIMNGYVGTTYITYLEENGPSSQYIQIGDSFTKINNHKVKTSNDVIYELMKEDDGIVDVQVNRNGELLDFTIDFGLVEFEGSQVLNYDFKVLGRAPKPIEYVTYPYHWGISIVKDVYLTINGFFNGSSNINDVSGPIGVASAIGKASKHGFKSLLQLAALININIGIINLLPIPMLDGGRIVIEIINYFTKGKISQKVYTALISISMVLLLMLVIYASYNDIVRLFI